MRGHIRKRGGSYEFFVDVGHQSAQRCDSCGKTRWVESRPVPICSCGGALRDPFQKRRQVAKGGFTRRGDCEKALSEALAGVGGGTFVAPSSILFTDHIAEWHGSRELADSTRAIDDVMFRAYIAPAFAGVKVQDVTTALIDRLDERLRTDGGRGGKPLSAKTRRNVRGLVYGALQEAVRLGIARHNAATNCRPIKLDRAKREAKMRAETWSPEQLRTFEVFTRDDRLYAAYRLLMTTGLRRGELLGLSWDALELENGTARIQQTLVKVGQRAVLKATPKTADSAGAIELDEATVAALKAHRKRQAEERLRMGELWADSGLVFTDEMGAPIHPDHFLRRFQALAQRAGLPPCRLHSIRHAYASALLEAGVPIEVISKRLRHANISITSDLYAHLSGKLDRQVAEQGAAYILGG